MLETAMELYVGGRAQGKLAYVQKVHEGENYVIVDGVEMTDFLKKDVGQIQGRVIWNHFHEYVRQQMTQESEERKAFLSQVLQRFPDMCVISDEVGCGIVPMEPGESMYRDETGSLLCILARKAERMERVICQIGQRIK